MLFSHYVTSIDSKLGQNGRLGVFEQLVAEAHYLKARYIAAGAEEQRDLFGRKEVPTALGAGPGEQELRKMAREWSAHVLNLGFLRETSNMLPSLSHLVAPRSKRMGSRTLSFVKIDRARHGNSETKEDVEERQNIHFPLFRNLAAFYRGEEPRDPEGDAVWFAFENPRNALRFAHAVAACIQIHTATPRVYRLILAEGSASFEEDGNVIGDALNVIQEIEAALKSKEAAARELYLTGRAVSIGSLVDEGLWTCLAGRFAAEGAECGELEYTLGKRALPRKILYAVSQPSGDKRIAAGDSPAALP